MTLRTGIHEHEWVNRPQSCKGVAMGDMVLKDKAGVAYLGVCMKLVLVAVSPFLSAKSR